MAVSEDFARLSDPFRPELLAHCYRMLGSVHDAEDQVQETMIRAWRSYGEFEGRASRQSIRLALIAALQYLPARQRAVLILHDVLRWRAAEVADLLGTTTAAVNGMLRRARARLEQAAPDADQMHEPADPADRALLDRYATAFENADITAVMQLLRDDAVFEMPPEPTWFTGRELIGRFLRSRVLTEPGRFRLIPP